MESDAKSVMKTVKFQILAPWVLFNFGPGKGVPIFTTALRKRRRPGKAAKVYGIMVKEAGFEGIPESHIHDRFGIPVPTGGEKTLRPPQPASPLPDNTKQAENKAVVMINTSVDPTDAWIDFYMKQLAPHFAAAREGALDEIEVWLRSLSEPPDQETFVIRINNVLGRAAASAISIDTITDAVAQIYSAFRRSVESPGVTLSFGGPDLRAMNFLGKLDHFYTSSWLKNPDAQSVMRNFITDALPGKRRRSVRARQRGRYCRIPQPARPESR